MNDLWIWGIAGGFILSAIIVCCYKYGFNPIYSIDDYLEGRQLDKAIEQHMPWSEYKEKYHIKTEED